MFGNKQPNNVRDQLLRTPISMVLAINLNALVSFTCGVGAYALWPESAQGWHAGVMSVFLGALSVAAAIHALKAIIKIHTRERQISALLDGSKAVQSSDLAGRDALKKAGMIDG